MVISNCYKPHFVLCLFFLLLFCDDNYMISTVSFLLSNSPAYLLSFKLMDSFFINCCYMHILFSLSLCHTFVHQM